MAEVADEGASRHRKTIVTEEALRVSPDVIGLTLARPWRRLCAILLDALLVSILAKELGVFFGFAAAYVLFRVSFRPTPTGSYLKRSFRFMFRMGGAVVLFLAVVGLWNAVGDRFSGEDGGGNGSVRAEITVDDDDVGSEVSLTPMQGLRFGADMVSLTTADNEGEARDAATKVLASMRAAGASGPQARETVREVAGGMEDRPWLMAAVEPVLRADEAADAEDPPATEEAVADSGAVVSEDSVILAYGAAISTGDSTSAALLRPRVVALLAADTVAALDDQINGRDEQLVELDEDRHALRERVDELEDELEREPGALSFLRSISESLGLGLGWFGLYFTATTAMWQGRTPGKRLFGIRVISLTGKPIGWWASFERFGGYAAGFATGLLGFLQVLWDDNRQAIHDKIASTAVIREVQPPHSLRRES
jgi:uncharacterized RDD family membrane protein YckC